MNAIFYFWLQMIILSSRNVRHYLSWFFPFWNLSAHLVCFNNNNNNNVSFLCLVCLWIIDLHGRAPKKNTSHGNEVLPQDTTHLIKNHVTNEEVRAKIQPAIRSHEDLLTIVKRRKLQWYGHVSRSSGLAKTTLQGTVKGGRRQGGQRKRWEDSIWEWTGLEYGRSSEGSGEQGKMEETGCEIICGAPTTLVV